jgi:aryl-alcohol dehydrogenase-like predicted oxidoreductase
VRDQVVIATKFGFRIETAAAGRARQPAARTSGRGGGVAQAARIDTIDLVYQHRVDPNVPIEDVAGAVKDLIAQAR